MIGKWINALLRPFNRRLQYAPTYDMLIRERDALRELARIASSPRDSRTWGEATPSGMVFSKDRAFQLDALLRSFLHHCRDSDAILHVLYRADTEAHQKAYDEVFSRLDSARIHPVPETDFHADVVNWIGQASSPAVYFLVDDVLFIRPFSLREAASFDLLQNIPALRLGKGQDYCYTRSCPQKIPAFQEMEKNGAFWCSWFWREAEHDWNFPLSVDGHLFDRNEMSVMLRHSAFRSPNSLETVLQTFIELYLDRRGIAYPEARLINIPWNRVQDEIPNRHGDISCDALLELWQAGKRLDVRAYESVSGQSSHQELSLHTEPRPS